MQKKESNNNVWNKKKTTEYQVQIGSKMLTYKYNKWMRHTQYYGSHKICAPKSQHNGPHRAAIGDATKVRTNGLWLWVYTIYFDLYIWVCTFHLYSHESIYKKYPFLIIYLILVYIQFQLNHFWNPKMYGFLPKSRSTPYTFGAFDFVQNHLLLFTYLFFVSLFKHIHQKEKEILREIEQDVCLVLVVFCCCCCYYRCRCRCRRCCRWSISLAQG